MNTNPEGASPAAQDELLSLGAAARLRGVAHTTVVRWTTRGVRGIRLQVRCRGGRTTTTSQFLEEFDERVTAARNGVPPSSYSRRRQKEIDQAEEQLRRD